MVAVARSWLTRPGKSLQAIYVYTYIFVVNFDALAQASDIRIERRQVVFLCWEQDSNPSGSPDTKSPADWMPADKPTELSRIKLKTWTRQPVPMISEHSAHSTPLPFWHSHLALAIYIFVVNFDALAQASDIRIERRQVVFVRRAGLLWSQQDFKWRWSVPLFKCLTVLEFSFILFDLCLLIAFFNFIMNYVPIVTFWIFTYHKIRILSIMFCFIWSYWIIYFLAGLEVSWRVVS